LKHRGGGGGGGATYWGSGKKKHCISLQEWELWTIRRTEGESDKDRKGSYTNV